MVTKTATRLFTNKASCENKAMSVYFIKNEIYNWNGVTTIFGINSPYWRYLQISYDFNVSSSLAWSKT